MVLSEFICHRISGGRIGGVGIIVCRYRYRQVDFAKVKSANLDKNI